VFRPMPVRSPNHKANGSWRPVVVEAHRAHVGGCQTVRSYPIIYVHFRPKILNLQVWNPAGFRRGSVTPFARSVTQNGAQCQGSVTI